MLVRPNLIGRFIYYLNKELVETSDILTFKTLFSLDVQMIVSVAACVMHMVVKNKVSKNNEMSIDECYPYFIVTWECPSL